MSAPLSSPRNEEKLDLEIQKLDLEAQSLRKKNKWDLRAQFMSPIIAMVLGIVGLSITLNQYRGQRKAEQNRTISEQQKDRQNSAVDQRSRLQNQIRTDIDEILRFPRDEKQTVSRVSFLLEDIKTVMDSTTYVDEKKQIVSDTFPEYKRRLTESLVILITNDCDFTRNARDVGLANTVIRHWDDYGDYLKTDRKKLDWIRNEYIMALESFRNANPGYLEEIQLGVDGVSPGPKYAKQEIEPILYARFIDILDGFKWHLDLSPENLSDQDKNRRERLLKQFLDTLHNTALSDYTICQSFPDRPCPNNR
jgi:hypothetical protein